MRDDVVAYHCIWRKEIISRLHIILNLNLHSCVVVIVKHGVDCGQVYFQTNAIKYRNVFD